MRAKGLQPTGGSFGTHAVSALCRRALVALFFGMASLAVTVTTDSASQRTHPVTRAHGVRVRVDEVRIRIMDGDTAEISWSASEKETVRVLGIDTPELFGSKRHSPNAPPPRAFSTAGAEARGFARGAFAVARDVELMRAATLDHFGRTLGYFFLDGRNYSVLAVRAGMASETVSRYGDNGFPREAEEVLEAARARVLR